MTRFEVHRASDGQFYFTLQAENNEVISTSEMYTTKHACNKAIKSVKKNAPVAPVIDLTT